MTRRTNGNRTHRTARRLKEAKSIEEAREQIGKIVPVNCRVYVHALFNDQRSHNSSYSSASYFCEVSNANVTIVDVRGSTPAALVTAVQLALQEPPKPKAPPPKPQSRALIPVRPAYEGEIDEDFDPDFVEPRGSTPRLSPRQLPLLTSGGGK
ncbi:hypothetical protein [Anatilimnocola floriformis]|uniref:hypothetical protein n=1 Tax=Anatilimnocola floriformis TaxID=2948575 RepID=UPI0020C59E66|nr:hypothetical protein [Anatilimnocola floriformis]